MMAELYRRAEVRLNKGPDNNRPKQTGPSRRPN